jgi:glycosyltransferase involved in cell wall biosynthesis
MRIALLSTYVPTECGIATFSENLVKAMDSLNTAPATSVLRVNPTPVEPEGQVAFSLLTHDLQTYLEAAEFVNGSHFDLVNIQHEFGIFGGEGGEHVIAFMKALRVPCVVTLHTVGENLEAHYKRVLGELVRLADGIVIMTHASADILMREYGARPERLSFIPHGVPVFDPSRALKLKKRLGLDGSPVLATFGLINPDKGIEYAIEAMERILKIHPDVKYLILGQTHPGVRAWQGEKYRESLVYLIRDLGIERNVIFEDRFLSKEELTDYLTAIDIYITPYLNPHQMVSGTMAYALGAGKPIISTGYRYALELLSDGRGMIVDFRDPDAMADCVIRLLSEPELFRRLSARAFEEGRKMIWPRVAQQYVRCFGNVLEEVPARRHLPQAARGAWILTPTQFAGGQGK